MKVDEINIHGVEWYHWDFQRIGMKGVGKNQAPIINMDKYIDHSMDEELHNECCVGITLCEDIKMGQFVGSIPPFELKKYGIDNWTHVIKYLDKYDPTGIHDKNLKKIIDITPPTKRVQMVYRYMYFALGTPIPWFFAIYLINNAFTEKTQESLDYNSNCKYFPKTIEYIKTLPFKTLGRILFFTTYPNAGVVTHRDSNMEPHKDHNINLFFTGSRPSYIWDDITEQKTYLEKDAKSYFFNNRDYHGVEPEPGFRYTLRVDGTFEDWLQEELGLVDGFTWKDEYQTA